MNQEANSISSNIFYSFLLKFSGILFPLISFPYVARVLDPIGVGQIDVVNSFVQNFLILAQFGIPILATRECAKNRENNQKFNFLVNKYFSMNLITMLASYILFIILVFLLRQDNSLNLLYFISSFSILASTINMEWFFQSLEMYKYISLRSIFIRFFATICLFVYVKTSRDVVNYLIISTLVELLNGGVNFMYLNRRIKLKIDFSLIKFSDLENIMFFFLITISISIYTNLDKVILNWLVNNTEIVAYYSAPQRLIKMIIAMVASLGASLLPRLSYYVENDEINSLKNVIAYSVNLVLLFSLPIFIGVASLSNEIIILFAGEKFHIASFSLMLMSPLVIIVPLGNIYGAHFLISKNKERSVLKISIIVAILNVILNVFLVRKFNYVGAVLTYILTEIFIAYKLIDFSGNEFFLVNKASLLRYSFGSFLIFLITRMHNLVVFNSISGLIFLIVFSATCYFVFLYTTHEMYFLTILDYFNKK